MKQKFFMVCLFAALSFNANAQIDVTINPIGLLFGNFAVGADIGFAEDISVEPRIGFSFSDGNLNGTDFNGTGFSAGAIGKYYFGPDDGCDKWHIGPYLDFNSIQFTADGANDVSWTRFGVGLYTGYKWVSGRGIVFDLGLGAGRNFVNEFDDGTDDEIDIANIPFLNINLTGKLAVGYRFGGGGGKR